VFHRPGRWGQPSGVGISRGSIPPIPPIPPPRQAPATRLVARTPAGDEAAAESSRAIAAVEQGWREEVGPARYDAMKDVLRELGRDSLRPG
jgi:hypothetical protein